MGSSGLSRDWRQGVSEASASSGTDAQRRRSGNCVEAEDDAPDLPGVAWVEGTIEEWSAEDVDVVYANAALHWGEDHHGLLPRLMRSLRPGGVLAVQMPRNFGKPSHRVLRELALSPRWSDRVGRLAGWPPVHEPAVY